MVGDKWRISCSEVWTLGLRYLLTRTPDPSGVHFGAVEAQKNSAQCRLRSVQALSLLKTSYPGLAEGLGVQPQEVESTHRTTENLAAWMHCRHPG